MPMFMFDVKQKGYMFTSYRRQFGRSVPGISDYPITKALAKTLKLTHTSMA